MLKDQNDFIILEILYFLAALVAVSAFAWFALNTALVCSEALS